MSWTKSDIVASVRETVRLKNPQKSAQRYLFPELNCVLLSRKRAAAVVDGLFEIMKRTLVQGEDVRIRGFGKFQTKFRWAKRGRNPRTGEMIIIPSRRSVTFKTSPKLRRRINHPEND
ncbi:MAG: integration host factor subunit alpha [Deltaproteobacteria bacterium]|nr:integration host factor subunit alpha [Deltaproteobacteria bacterium]MBW1816082.1 integration host factor subunit alpha [Deltaproteobacteria bacterium]